MDTAAQACIGLLKHALGLVKHALGLIKHALGCSSMHVGTAAQACTCEASGVLVGDSFWYEQIGTFQPPSSTRLPCIPSTLPCIPHTLPCIPHTLCINASASALRLGVAGSKPPNHSCSELSATSSDAFRIGLKSSTFAAAFTDCVREAWHVHVGA